MKKLKLTNKLLKIFSFGWKIGQTKMGRYFYNLLISKRIPEKISLEDFELYLHKNRKDAISEILTLEGEWEPLQTKIIKEEVKLGDIVFDIGANIGYYSIILSKLVGSEGKVYAFEPEEENLKLLRKNLTLNNCQNVIVIPCCVINKNKKVRLYLSLEDMGNHSMKNKTKEFQEVRGICLDNFMKENKINQVDFIKIDAEGSELDILIGLKDKVKLINKFTIEYCPECLNKKEQNKIIDFIYNNFNNVFYIKECFETPKKINKSDLKNMDLEGSYINFLVSNKEDLEYE